jgi:hypothetical protein
MASHTSGNRGVKGGRGDGGDGKAAFIVGDEADPGSIRLRLKVVPGSRRDEVAGVLGDRVKVRVTQPPERGKANAAVERVLAGALGVDERRVSIVQGHASAEKVARVEGMSRAEVEAWVRGRGSG